MTISSQSVVHPDAQIGNHVVIEPFAKVEADVVIGDNTVIQSFAVVCNGSRIGQNCTIHNGAIIGGIPQDLKFQGEDSLLVIGDHTVVREYATLNRGTASKGKTTIGNHCLIMAYVHIAHDCEVRDHIILGNQTQLSGEVEVDDWAIISGMTGVHQFVRIGKHTMIAAGSLVRQDIPPYTKMAREPLSYVGLNAVGLRRRNFPKEMITNLQTIYRIIYQEGLRLSTAIEKIKADTPDSEERKEVLAFIESSQRGISNR